jgi:hypothetical protein
MSWTINECNVDDTPVRMEGGAAPELDLVALLPPLEIPRRQQLKQVVAHLVAAQH